MVFICFLYFFFCKQKTVYEFRISDWSSDVCSSDLQQKRASIFSALYDRDPAMLGHYHHFSGLEGPKDITAFDACKIILPLRQSPPSACSCARGTPHLCDWRHSWPSRSARRTTGADFCR